MKEALERLAQKGVLIEVDDRRRQVVAGWTIGFKRKRKAYWRGNAVDTDAARINQL